MSLASAWRVDRARACSQSRALSLTLFVSLSDLPTTCGRCACVCVRVCASEQRKTTQSAMVDQYDVNVCPTPRSAALSALCSLALSGSLYVNARAPLSCCYFCCCPLQSQTTLASPSPKWQQRACLRSGKLNWKYNEKITENFCQVKISKKKNKIK